eukprot:PhF_6_TR43505/c0_g1_i1/m.66784
MRLILPLFATIVSVAILGSHAEGMEGILNPQRQSVVSSPSSNNKGNEFTWMKSLISTAQDVTTALHHTMMHAQQSGGGGNGGGGNGGGSDTGGGNSGTGTGSGTDASTTPAEDDPTKYAMGPMCQHGVIAVANVTGLTLGGGSSNTTTSVSRCLCPLDMDPFIYKLNNRTFCLERPTVCDVSLVQPKRNCRPFNPELDPDSDPVCIVLPFNAPATFTINVSCRPEPGTVSQRSDYKTLQRYFNLDSLPITFATSTINNPTAVSSIQVPGVSGTTSYPSVSAVRQRLFTYFPETVFSNTSTFINESVYSFGPYNFFALSDVTFQTTGKTSRLLTGPQMTGKALISHTLDIANMNPEFFAGARLYIEAVVQLKGGEAYATQIYVDFDIDASDAPSWARKWRRGSRVPASKEEARRIAIAVPTVLLTLAAGGLIAYLYWRHANAEKAKAKEKKRMMWKLENKSRGPRTNGTVVPEDQVRSIRNAQINTQAPPFGSGYTESSESDSE